MRETFLDSVVNHLKAGTPVMMINTDEERRVIGRIKEAILISYDGQKIRVEEKQWRKLRASFGADRWSTDPTVDYAESGLISELLFDEKNDYCIIVRAREMLAIQNQARRELENARTKMEQTAYATKINTLDEMMTLVCPIVEWDVSYGFQGKPPDVAFAYDLEGALKECPHDKVFDSDTVFVFKDAHHKLDTDENARRVLRGLVADELLTGKAAEFRKHIFFIQPEWTLHRDLQASISMLEFALPDAPALAEIVADVQEGISDPTKRTLSTGLKEEIVTSLRGFTEMEAINALSYCVAKHGGFTSDVPSTVRSLQRQAFAKNGVLTLVDDADIAQTEALGGFENAIEFAERAAICYGDEARKAGLRRPKGCLLLGIPGTGKTVFGKVLSRIMGLPLIIFDVGALFGSLVGETESATRAALRKVKAKGPCVLLIDEADKVFSGSVRGQNDSGVSTRMLGYILSFMSNDNDEAFVVFTMNSIVNIPKELLRAGRLDALFWTTFPTPRERADILGIHLQRYGSDLNAYDEKAMERLVDETDRYVGGELEQLVIEATRMSYLNRKSLTPSLQELLFAKELVTPVARLDETGIAAMDQYCKEAARPVSKDGVVSKVFTPGTNRRQIRTTP